MVEGYTAVTGSMLSLILYLLPLMTLFQGSFSLTSEKEEGSWQLLSTYPVGTLSFILGEYMGLASVLLIIVAFGYGLMGLISSLGLLPYLWVKPLLVARTILNPAELVRLFVVIKLGGGSVLGPEYYQWVEWINRSNGSLLFLVVCLVWILVSIVSVYWVWERGRSRG